MTRMVLSHLDAHFEENVRLAGNWGEDDSFRIRYKIMGKEPVTRDVFRITAIQYSGKPVLRVRHRQGDSDYDPISFTRLLSVAWRPDIRRYDK